MKDSHVLTVILPIFLFAIGLSFIIEFTWLSFILMLAGWVLIAGLGGAVGHHRIFSHRTHELPRWKKLIVMFFAMLTAQGSTIWWTALHRGYHHPHADKKRDLHSPIHGSFSAFFGWMFKINSRSVSLKYSIDLARDPDHLFLHKHFRFLLFYTYIVIAIISPFFLLWFILVPTCISILQDNCVNLFCHLRRAGYRNFETSDNSVNVPVLGYLGWGQGWHNNHHKSPATFDFGSAVSGKWWEFDPCNIFLPLLGKPSGKAD